MYLSTYLLFSVRLCLIQMTLYKSIMSAVLMNRTSLLRPPVRHMLCLYFILYLFLCESV